MSDGNSVSVTALTWASTDRASSAARTTPLLTLAAYLWRRPIQAGKHRFGTWPLTTLGML